MTDSPPVVRARPAESELTSLDERLGLLLLVRIGFVILVVAGALFASGTVGLDLGQIGPLSAAFLVVAGAAESYRRTRLRGRMLVHRAVLPLDAVYLAVVTAASGGSHSPFLILFAVQLIAVTLLASGRAGLRTALWDTFLFVLMPTAALTTRVASFLGVHHVYIPSDVQVTLVIAGFWAVAGCTAVFSSVSERELRRSKAEMAALAEMASGLEALGEEEEILGLLLRTFVTAFPLERGALWYVRNGRPVGLVLEGAAQSVRSRPVAVTAGVDQVAVTAWAHREPQLVRRLNPGTDPAACELLPGATNVVVLPLQVDGGNSGIVFLEHGGNPVNARLPRRTLVMLVQFAGHAALALRNARLLAERERLAAIDGLTGLANRREFDQVLAREVNRAERTREPLSLVVFDVDHFKAINDTRGHLGGDEVLRAIAEVLGGAVREMDLVARYGGEEFAIILPRCDQHDAIRVVERITVTSRQRADLDGVTLSAGLATIPFNAHDGLSLVAAADEAMYESKRSGRNRYSVSARRRDGAHHFGASCA
ncbi:MAG TPA: GGDEF domain-containing protein [Acidimicrobiales bacterium]|nr:GGDEF domain-containing protein [Acidimicrobiales bacterium]